MYCPSCKSKVCRQLECCPSTSFSREDVLESYREPELSQGIVEAAKLVDGGRAGSLSRLEEIGEYFSGRGWMRVGLAYCYGMEEDAQRVGNWLRSRGFRVSAVSCTTGGLAQDEVNPQSSIHKVSCNPLGQARQLRNEGVQAVVAMGLCLGHDMMLNQELSAVGLPVTVLVVKDRTNGHRPLDAIRSLA